MFDVIHSLLASFKGEVTALACAALWAFGSIIYSRVGRHVAPIPLNLTKNLFAIGMFLVVLMARGQVFGEIEGQAWLMLLVSGAVGVGFGDTAYFESLNCLGPRRALLLAILAPPLVGLLAFLFLGEDLGTGSWLGILLTIAGVTWVVTERVLDMTVGHVRLGRGVSFGLLAALSQAAAVVLSRAALTRTSVDPFASALIRLIGAVVVLLVWVTVSRRPRDEWPWYQQSKKRMGFIILATFTGTFLGIGLQQVALKLTDAGIVQTLTSTSPLFVLPMLLFLGERISPRAVLGALLALTGVVFLFIFKG